MSDLKDIWPDPAPDDQGLPEDQLMAYLEGKLSAEEQHQVEEWLSREGMESDAVEGLQALTPNETRRMALRLNQQLQQTLKKKKPRRRDMMPQRWTLIAIIIILLLLLLCFVVFYRMKSAG